MTPEGRPRSCDDAASHRGVAVRIEYRLVERPSGVLYRDLLRASLGAVEWMGLVAAHRDADVMAPLEPFLVRVEEVTEWPGTQTVGRVEYRWIYSVSEGTVQALLESSSSLMDWQRGRHPGDLHLMRADGGVWLASCTCEEDYWLELDEAEYAMLASRWPRVTAALQPSVLGDGGFARGVESGRRLRSGELTGDLVRRYVTERSSEWPFPYRLSATGTVRLFDDLCMGLDADTATRLAAHVAILASTSNELAEFSYLALLIVELIDDSDDIPPQLVEQFESITARTESLSRDDPWMWWVEEEWTQAFLPWRGRPGLHE
jgi:hypothetical protein